MGDQQALFEKFLHFLQTEPVPPEYLGKEPESAEPFDPYQMVAEWVALRHEVKQQGKLLQASQNSLQQALAGLQDEKTHLQQQLEASAKSGSAQLEQKTLWRDLLNVVDALDQACLHWQEQIAALDAARSHPEAQSFWQSFWQNWVQHLTLPESTEVTSTASLRDILVSNQEGIALIRRSLLNVLRQRQVIPIEAQGQPFNPQTMYAIARQESRSVAENTVLQEAVRGYMWGDQILREAQVIVAAKEKEQG